jgi:hypothetical protein
MLNSRFGELISVAPGERNPGTTEGSGTHTDPLGAVYGVLYPRYFKY